MGNGCSQLGSPEILMDRASSPKAIMQHMILRCYSGALGFSSEGKMVIGPAGTGSCIEPVPLRHLKCGDSKALGTSSGENCGNWGQRRSPLGL